MSLRIVLYERSESLGDSPERELQALRGAGKAGKKDEGRLRAVIQNCWATQGMQCTQLDFKPIEGAPYEKKLWEARYLKTARSDGVHGYRLFYRLARDPKTSSEQVAVLLMVWGKEGPTTPKEVLAEAWKRYLEVEELLINESFFRGEEQS